MTSDVLTSSAEHAIYLQTIAARGRSAGNIKPAFLDIDPNWHPLFPQIPADQRFFEGSRI